MASTSAERPIGILSGACDDFYERARMYLAHVRGFIGGAANINGGHCVAHGGTDRDRGRDSGM